MIGILNDSNFSLASLDNVHNYELMVRAIANKTVTHHVSAIERFKSSPYVDDPLFLGYRPLFHYTVNSGLLAPEEFTDSALAYLKRIGEETRYEALKQFIRQLQKVNVDMPYMFQTIEGLAEAKNNFNKTILKENNIISFGMLETLDMRIQGLIQSYQNIAYDSIRHVWVLPRNLRQFSISIVVYPIGVYNVGTNLEAESIPNAKSDGTGFKKPADNILAFNHLMFEFAQCEFDIESSGQTFIESVNNAEIEMATTSLAFKYTRVRQSGVFKSLLGQKVISPSSFAIINAVKEKQSGNRILNFVKDAAAPVLRDINQLKERFKSLEDFKAGFGELFGSAREYLERNAQAFLTNQINRLYLGNVYETSPADIVAMANSRTFENLLINSGRAFNNDSRRGTSGQGTPPNENIYGQS
ncbi:gp255 [Sphingomonas phage PAU]|uniref:gp255 n=1 Tax=Sphingomonas phage PAU TaxID=1150991 RepID=UPI0002573405|nr:gp255 [Sphingomonas phage PAU]AFF28253.1 gp255 [Sphingomonas phage PAU]